MTSFGKSFFVAEIREDAPRVDGYGELLDEPGKRRSLKDFLPEFRDETENEFESEPDESG